jgi:lysophospholipase L1-like esterase
VLPSSGMYMLKKAVRYAQSAFLILTAQKYERPLKHAPRILVAGDSTGYGTGASSEYGSIAGRIGGQFKQYAIENISKNGLTLSGLSSRLAELAPSDEFEIIVLQIGGNDVLRKTPIDEVKISLQKVFDTAHLHTQKIVVISSGNVGGAALFSPYGSPKSKEYEMQTLKVREAFMVLAKKNNAHYVDLFVEPKDDVFMQEPKKYLAIDGLHPSSDGYAVWYEKLHPALVELLQTSLMQK